jgi:hypothetical protein
MKGKVKKVKTNLSRRSVAEVLSDLNNAKLRANSRQVDSYILSIKLLSTLPIELPIEVRAVNGGDIAEVVLKYHAQYLGYTQVVDTIISYSSQGRKDLDKAGVCEVKYFGATNNTPNGTLTPKAFYGISKYGVHHFTYDLVKQYFKDFKLDARKGTRAMTYSMMKSLVLSGKAKRIDDLSIALGL